MAEKTAYRLQTLFNLRERAKKAKEEEYAKKQQAVALEQKKLDEMHQKLRDMQTFREDKKREYADKLRQGTFAIAEMQGKDRHIDRLKHEEAAFHVVIARQQEALDITKKHAQEALDALLDATRAFKALEKHREKWTKGVRREEMFREELVAEDIAQARFVGRKKEEQ